MKKTEKICSIDGCNRVHLAKGFCNMHYKRWNKHGNPLFTKIERAANGDPMRFIEEAVKNAGEECIIWPYGTDSNGYGQIRIGSKTEGTRLVPAHRLALLISGEEDPGNKLDAAHGDCHDTLCINPKHLSFKTRSENQKDRLRDGTDANGEKCNKAKLTEEKVREIFNDPRKYLVIAGEYGVSVSTIGDIKTGKTWKHLELTTHITQTKAKGGPLTQLFTPDHLVKV